MQKLIVYTKEKIMDVYQDDKLIKTFNDVWIGKDGTVPDKDMTGNVAKTPLGTYNLGIAFGFHDQNIDYPYIKIDENSYWAGEGKNYNKFVEIGKKIDNRGFSYITYQDKKDFIDAEHLIDYPKQYEYAYFIEQNVQGIINHGSAIFLHVKGDKGYTGGCVAINRNEMIYLFKTLKYSEKPIIEITNKDRK